MCVGALPRVTTPALADLDYSPKSVPLQRHFCSSHDRLRDRRRRRPVPARAQREGPPLIGSKPRQLLIVGRVMGTRKCAARETRIQNANPAKSKVPHRACSLSLSRTLVSTQHVTRKGWCAAYMFCKYTHPRSCAVHTPS